MLRYQIKLKLKTTIKNKLLASAYLKRAELIYRNLRKKFNGEPEITISLFDDREEFCRAIGNGKNKAPDWLVAFIPSRSRSYIYIFDPAKKMSKKMVQILTHEICHIYLNILNSSLPDWVKEGVAVYIAKQVYFTTISVKDWHAIAPKKIPFQNTPWHKTIDYNGFNIAGLIISFFVERFGWNDFLRILRAYKKRETIYKTIVKIFPVYNVESLIGELEEIYVK
ncbi:MAG: hypothetical protein UW11_C0019G0019 [Parcubacteria group bacterium GW2011_GWA2_43_9b]|nr:MAG: hypothetical protein UW11_C0019G0019 [Parcubacteria group bacterium GW2011_GWA2_43_9b]